MKHRDEIWGWMLAVDFFFAGMGGGMVVIAGLSDLLAGPGHTSLLGNTLGPIFVALGAGMLILELGRPLQAWRVFLNPKAILTIGAWCMLVVIVAGLFYASFGIGGASWADWGLIRTILAVVCVAAGLVVAAYPGVLLGAHKARPFWTGPGMSGLFLLSSLITGSAAHFLSGYIYPVNSAVSMAVLRWALVGILGAQFLLWLAYLWVKRNGGTEQEALATAEWINGDMALAFWAGFMGLGTLLALMLLPARSAVFQLSGAALAILGGALMRWMVVRSGKHRTWLPGEENYRARLPRGDEDFLKAWTKN